MKRTPEPHGTKAAYMRHWRAGEPACDLCSAAASRTGMNPNARESKRDNAHNRHFDEVLKRKPPRIVWRKNRRGVFVAVSVHDPHTARTEI